MINIGCGNRFHPEWKNLDLHTHAPGVISCDLTKGIPFEDASACVVYAAAVLEHIRRVDVPKFLSECKRVLRPDGIVRLAVPDLEQQARVYLNTIARLDAGDLSAEADRQWMVLEMLDQSIREEIGGEMLKFLKQEKVSNIKFIAERIGEEGRDLISQIELKRGLPKKAKKLSLYDTISGGILGRTLLKWLIRSDDLSGDLRALAIGRFRLNSGEVHQCAYDRFSLAHSLIEAGFKNVTPKEHGESSIDRWKDFHLEVNRDGMVEKPDLLIMEAIK
jgi:predicted SAM-dependent methyltransferase